MRRADAMVRCALDLGLRIGEVARLGLDDIDWRAGTVTLRRTKGRREDVMPLPEPTGRAIAAYLFEERPQTQHRMVFASHKTPRER
jgi:integrase